ncbi:hypothetical protein [Photorhabdus cinerea]|uniref:Baseplate protein J-like domain-containing protein n=1 Tax=Photorhabdus cinerea TaxID=471575 RepID=A0A7X5TGP9_9GAMM|nr:hypothetical protein [Photorhabdus cinerea]NHB91623.1 hypothetical protein [Photorhabdus cinerea]
MKQAELENKLTAIVPNTAFKLDERNTLDILNWLQEYAKKIPFDQEKKQFWDSFYFIQENSPQQLADIYQNIDEANGLLPAHQAFVLAFLKLLETTNLLLNTFPAQHRDLYYRQLLGLKPRNAQADSVAISISLNTDNPESRVAQGTLFDAGQDSAGNPLQYASDTELLANQGTLTDLRWHRKDSNGWQSAILLNLADNISLPENGIQLFSPTAHDVQILSGYLITSPLFAMSEGERSITLKLASPWDGDDKHIMATISSGDHWLSLSTVKKDNQHLTLHLSANNDPISPPDNLDGMTFDVPVLKLGTIQGTALPTITEITINIIGNRNVLYASDSGIEQTDTTSFPFDQSPLLGSGFNLVSPEWYGTENATLTITPQWIGLPTENFSTWYAKYNPKPANNSVFKVQGYLVTPQRKTVINDPLSLFEGNNAPQGKSLSFNLPAMNYPLADSPSPNDWPASIRIELAEHDFLHTQYWKNPTDKNLPYTPQMSALQVQFCATAKPQQFSIYPLTPFGWSETETNLPPLADNTFYLGFTGVFPGQTLSLYWQLESFSEFSISWFYLNKDNTWQPLTKLVHDQTRNLFDRGAWRTLLPQDASNQAVQMPTRRYWLKAQMTPKLLDVTEQNNSLNYPIIKGLLYNATTATLINTETIEPDHFINGLAAGSIKQLVNTSVAVSDITQPWASWDGRPPETEQSFLTRVSAHLSHRNRVLSWGSIVTLLKDHFISLFDVKYPSTNELTQIPASEQQQLIVIPDSRYKDNDDALRPMLKPARLQEMAEWLGQLSSPWTTIVISNPTYINVLISYQLVFVSGVNPSYGHYQLQQELSRKYMPWGENTSIGVTTGNHIDYYQLLATIQQSPLIERVTDLKMTIPNRYRGIVGESIEAADNEVLILVWPDNTASSQGVDNE